MTDVEHQVSHGDVDNLLKIVSYTVVGSLTKKFGKTNKMAKKLQTEISNNHCKRKTMKHSCIDFQ